MVFTIIVHARDRWSGAATEWQHQTVTDYQLASALANWQAHVGRIVEQGQLKVTHVTHAVQASFRECESCLRRASCTHTTNTAYGEADLCCRCRNVADDNGDCEECEGDRG